METVNKYIGSLIFFAILSMSVSYLSEFFGYWPIGFVMAGAGFIVGWTLGKERRGK